MPRMGLALVLKSRSHDAAKGNLSSISPEVVRTQFWCAFVSRLSTEGCGRPGLNAAYCSRKTNVDCALGPFVEQGGGRFVYVIKAPRDQDAVEIGAISIHSVEILSA